MNIFGGSTERERERERERESSYLRLAKIPSMNFDDLLINLRSAGHAWHMSQTHLYSYRHAWKVALVTHYLIPTNPIHIGTILGGCYCLLCFLNSISTMRSLVWWGFPSPWPISIKFSPSIILNLTKIFVSSSIGQQ